MGNTVLETRKNCSKKIEIMEHALAWTAGVCFTIDITDDRCPGRMLQVIDGIEYSVNSYIGLKENCRYSDVVAYWSEKIPEKEKESFLSFFSIPHLLSSYENGVSHIFHRYDSFDLFGNYMMAEQHVVMYEDEESGHLMALSYILDRTRLETLKRKDEEQKRILEEDILKIEGLVSQYSVVYFINLENGKWSRYVNDKHISEQDGPEHTRYNDFQTMFRGLVENFTHPDYKEELLKYTDREYVAKLLENKKRHIYRFRQLGKDGEYVWLELSVIKFDRSGEDARLVAFCLSNVDEEEKKKEEQHKMMVDALAAAEHANRAKTVFLNNMSHDIRTPMNAIIGYTALAASHLDNTELVKDYLKKISVSGSHLLSLINDILDMSRIESGRVKVEEKEVHLPDVLHDLRTIIQSSISSKRQDLFIDTQDIVNEDIITDKLRLNQVLLNIVSNAIKFTPVGGMISIRITELPCALKGYTTFVFRIRDNGIGMSEEFQKHIFESFTREQSSTVSGIQGSGLGMAITKNIVDMMGGSISVKSEEEKGTEFTISFDFRISSSVYKYEAIPELEGARALVADDDTNTCISVSKMLKEIGMRADWTVSGKEAVVRATEAFMEGDEFKVYIIDWLMPDMNGIETVRRIRKVIGDKVPIIILTAYDWTDIEAEAKEAGVTAFVAKPIFMSELREALTLPRRKEVEIETKGLDFSGKRVLLVEDNEINQEIAREILEDVGFKVDVAEDGIAAVDRVSASPSDLYDIILMDIQMPRMNGFMATREIRTLEDNRKANLPIVAMTANAFEEDRKSAFECGMNGFISKPISIDKLMGTLSSILS